MIRINRVYLNLFWGTLFLEIGFVLVPKISGITIRIIYAQISRAFKSNTLHYY
jgi:hypothetical protein